jgi:hypothetical protein
LPDALYNQDKNGKPTRDPGVPGVKTNEAVNHEPNNKDINYYLKKNDILIHFAFTNDINKEIIISDAPTNSSTPVGFYCYETGTYEKGLAHFASSRPYIFIIKPKTSLRIFDVEKMTETESNNKLLQLINIVEPNMVKDILGKIKKFEKQLPKQIISLPGARLYYIIMKSHLSEWKKDEDFRVSFTDTNATNPKYATELLKALGYDGIKDTTGTIWSSEPEQVCLFDTNSFNVEDVVENPNYEKRDLDIVV